MYHAVVQKSPGGRPVDDDHLNHHRRRVSRQGQGPPAGPPGDRHVALSPTQQSFNPNHPPPPLQHPPGQPLPPTLQPSYAPPPGASPPSALPGLGSSLYPRESPVKGYYDPTMDSADAALNRRPSARYEPFPAEHRDRAYGEPRPAAFDKPYEPKPYENRYEKPYENQYEKPYQSPGNSYARPSPIHLPAFAPGRDNMPGSPLSPTAYSSYNREPQPHFSSPVRPPSQDTPARKVDPMSLSSIMSGNDDPPSYKSQESRRSSRATLPAQLERQSTPTPTPSLATLAPAPSTPAERAQLQKLVNGHAKGEANGVMANGRVRPDPLRLLEEIGSIDAMNDGDVKLLNHESWSVKYKHSATKRTLAVEEAEAGKRKRRRLYHTRRFLEIFEASANRGKEEYTRANESKAWRDVTNAEQREEKERKKDQQRKRRRERALQQENLKREEALERAEKAEDGEEREKAIKEAEKRSKKIRQTTKLLSGIDDSKEIREVTPQNHNLEGGIMGSFQMSDDLRDSRRGSKGARMSTRPRKSKEQKQAEKDQAAAAQAAIERGEDLPSIAPTEAARLEMLEKAEPPRVRPKSKTKKRGRKDDDDELDDEDDEDEIEDEKPKKKDRARVPLPKKEQFVSKAYNQLFESIWKDMAKRDVGKVLRIKNESTNTRLSNSRKTAQLAGKEARRFQLRTNKSTKDVQARAKRSMREMLSFWKRNERDERDQRKMAERQELENAKRLEAEREAARQRRKLDFLMRQTEIYSHFIGKKVKTQELERSTDDADAEAPPTHDLEPDEDIPEPPDRLGKKVTNFDELDFNDEDESTLKAAAMTNAQHAIKEARDRVKAFDDDANSQMDDGELNFQNPSSLQTMDVKQPEMLTCQLKEYQLKGLNWLVNLYEQGINGILADEMGLGKTVQSISVMAYLAETHNIWGPFLVIAPASTLHNWQQEIQKFVPTLKALPYWGNAKDRKVLRKFWERKKITYREDAPFHVLITSYQLVVQDAQYFQRMTWQYMILDEAQAIKSSQSSRWKSLLGFHCRNRLLLTGTPIQNNMQELWALLHFIMPTLFDSHDEFSEWFSKDIESHAQSNTKLNEDQLRRLHMILKPFMLRRIKKHVQKELGDKIELDEFCDLTYRQRAYYSSLRNKISLMDLIEKANFGDDQDTATLMNLVMQFRKVCNHPDLFERADTASPLSFSYWAETASFVREGQNVDVAYSVRNMIEYRLPRLVYRDGRLDVAGPDNERAGWRGKALDHMMNVFSPEHVAESSRTGGAFSWLRFADASAAEVHRASKQGLFQRAVDLRRAGRDLARLNVPYEDDYSPVHSMFNIAARADRRPLAEACPDGRMASLLSVAASTVERSGIRYIEPCAWPPASAPPITVDCATMATHYETRDFLFNVPMRAALYGVTVATDEALVEQRVPLEHYPVTDMLPPPGQCKARYTHITVPSMRRFVSDCGKLARLDALLKQLKEGGHRVLLYFQMTRMIDLMEEYLTYRNYKYCRLDGSTKLEDRRDTVADFQTRPDIFVFLLSTRAGGLGINLTSADTVIFYDSDWNPTIDSQAMDRAHRLGQTRQVTVYRLITRGTIEERIRKRALQKEEVQRVVISGQTSSVGAAADKGAPGAAKPAPAPVVDFNTRSRENRTKDIALWLADDEQAEEIERRERLALEALARGDQAGGARGKKRRRAPAGTMEDMYHEGEGHFEDSAKPSGAATPVENAVGDGSGAAPSKRKRGISKKAKSLKQRLAIADGEVNA